MFKRSIQKYISHPVSGLTSFILYSILHTVMTKQLYAIGISLLFSIIVDLVLSKFSKDRVYSFIFHISTISLLFTFIFFVFTTNNELDSSSYLIFCEFWIIVLLMVLQTGKTYILVKRDSSQKIRLSKFFQSVTTIQYLLIIHLLITLLNKQIAIKTHSYNIPDIFLFTILLLCILSMFDLYQAFKVKLSTTKLRGEEWLPIVSEKGEVNGKITKSASLKMKRKFLHPVVRIALISNGKVYLQERNVDDILNSDKLDYPFENYVLFNQGINTSVHTTITQIIGNEINYSLQFLIKYIFENDNIKRLSFIFVVNIKDENSIEKYPEMKGKFWTIKEIEERFSDDIFSECFELEFEYLKNMVLK